MRKQSPDVKIQVELTLPREVYMMSFIKNLHHFKTRLDRHHLGEMKIDRVLMLGQYFNEPSFKSFLAKELKLENELIAPVLLPEERTWKLILMGLNAAARKIIELREEEERRQREEEERQRAVEMALKLKTDRAELLAEIRQVCRETDEKETYLDTFVAKGRELGMPAEVIRWNIEEVLNNSALAIVEPPIALPVAASVSSPVGLSVVPPNGNGNGHTGNGAQQPPIERNLPSLKEDFEIKGILLDTEFTSQKAVLIGDNEYKAIRLLKAEEVQNPERRQAFEFLYQKELTYYQELSEISEAAEGMYYFRNYIPRDSLKDYLRKTSLDQKLRFDKLNSKDIKFILRVLDEVKNLPVAHANLNEYNILVLRSGRLNRNQEIRFVGFTSEECTLTEMEDRIHSVFYNLLKPNVYEEFRQKLNV